MLQASVPQPHPGTCTIYILKLRTLLKYYSVRSIASTTSDLLLHAPRGPDAKTSDKKINREHGSWHGVAAERTDGRAERSRGGPSLVALESIQYYYLGSP